MVDSSVTEIPFITGELILAGVWLLCRAFLWIWQKRIRWKREAVLLLMCIDLAVIIRFVFFPFFTLNGHVQSLFIDWDHILPFRLNLVPFVHIAEYESRREAVINIAGNLALFIPTGILLPILYRRLHSFGKVLLVGGGISLCIELIQLLFQNSVTDIDDLILNTAGIAVGYGLYKLVQTCKRHKE